MNICIKLIQVYNLSCICGPVLSPTGVHIGRYKHWILILLSASSQEKADWNFSVVEKKQHKGTCHFNSDLEKEILSLSGLGEHSSKRSFWSHCKGKELTIFIAYLIYLYITMSIVGTLHMLPTFLISSPFCHSPSIASSAWVMCLLSAYQKIVLLLFETGEKTRLSCLGILYGRNSTHLTYRSLKASFWNVTSTLLQLFILIKFILGINHF